jgi:hypothetical protein
MPAPRNTLQHTAYHLLRLSSSLPDVLSIHIIWQLCITKHCRTVKIQLGFYPGAKCAFASASEAVPDAMARCQPILHRRICRRAQHIGCGHIVGVGLWKGLGSLESLDVCGMDWRRLEWTGTQHVRSSSDLGPTAHTQIDLSALP